MSDDLPPIQLAVIDGEVYRGRWYGHKFIPSREAREDLHETAEANSKTLREVKDALFQGR